MLKMHIQISLMELPLKLYPGALTVVRKSPKSKFIHSYSAFRLCDHCGSVAWLIVFRQMFLSIKPKNGRKKLSPFDSTDYLSTNY